MLEYSQFDSEWLGLRTARLNIVADSVVQPEEIESGAKEGNFSFVLIKHFTQDFLSINKLAGKLGIVLTDIKVNLVHKKKNICDYVVPPGFQINHHSKNIRIPGNFADTIADRSQYARFFGLDKGRELYRRWLSNSLNENSGKKKFILAEENKSNPVGLVSCAGSKSEIDLELVLARQDYQGKGLMVPFISYLIDTLYKDGFKRITVSTQLDNITALSFYQKTGFRIIGYRFDYIYSSGRRVK